ncbi:MAG: oligosaccharide flippase family protein [Bacteroidetes bacterium]|nr:oligosaccharide flippase family protein [Bacteroidota bacterium]
MFQKIKSLFTQTAIYGTSTIVGRLLNFLLVPFYTNVLLPDEYGIVAYIFSIIALVGMIYGFGLEAAFFKYSTSKEGGNIEKTFSTSFLSLSVTSILLSTIILLNGEFILNTLSLEKLFLPSIYFAAITLAFDSFAAIPFSLLRLKNQAKYFAIVKILNIVITILSNIYFLLYLDFGVNGIFLSSAIASVGTVIFLLPVIYKNFSFQKNYNLMENLWRYGLPLIPAGIATTSLQIIDRPILRILTTDATVGIYQANYRLGIFMMLVVQMFDFAWRPFYFSHSNDADSKKIMSRVMIYFTLLLFLIFLIFSFFIPDIIALNIFGKSIIHQNYWSGLHIVPVILLAYLFFGLSNIFSAGLYIEKKTHLVPIASIIAAGLKIVLTFILVPFFEIMGAAIATLVAYLSLAITMLLLSQKAYPIQYEWARFSKITFVSLIIFLTTIFFEQYASNQIILKIILLLLFIPLLYLFKFFNAEEKNKIKKILFAKS